MGLNFAEIKFHGKKTCFTAGFFFSTFWPSLWAIFDNCVAIMKLEKLVFAKSTEIIPNENLSL